jgi:hypothetical protein
VLIKMTGISFRAVPPFTGLPCREWPGRALIFRVLKKSVNIYEALEAREAAKFLRGVTKEQKSESRS